MDKELKIKITVDKKTGAIKVMDGDFKELASTIKNANTNTKKFSDSLSNKAEKSVKSFTASLIKMAAGAVGIYAINRALQKYLTIADSMNNLDARLRLVTKSTAEFAFQQKELLAISKDTYSNIQDITKLYVKLDPALKQLGASTLAVDKITSSFSKGLKLGGASTEEASAATLQFAQAMGSGVLRGDEFNSMAEASPKLMEYMAKGMGVPQTALRNLATEGKLTAGAVSTALLEMSGEIDKDFKTMPLTVGKATTNLNTDIQKIVSDFDKATGISGTFAESINNLSGNVSELSTELVGFVTDTKDFLKEHNESLDVAANLVKTVGISYATFIAGGAVVTGIEAITTSVVALRAGMIGLQASIPVLGWISAAVGVGAAAYLLSEKEIQKENYTSINSIDSLVSEMIKLQAKREEISNDSLKLDSTQKKEKDIIDANIKAIENQIIAINNSANAQDEASKKKKEALLKEIETIKATSIALTKEEIAAQEKLAQENVKVYDSFVGIAGSDYDKWLSSSNAKMVELSKNGVLSVGQLSEAWKILKLSSPDLEANVKFEADWTAFLNEEIIKGIELKKEQSDLAEKWSNIMLDNYSTMLDSQINLASSTNDWQDGLTGVAGTLSGLSKAFSKIRVDELKATKAQFSLDSKYQKAYEGMILTDKQAQIVSNNYTKESNQIKEQSLENQINGYGSLAGVASQMFEQGSAQSEALIGIQKTLSVVTGITAIAKAMSVGDPYTAVARGLAVAATLASFGWSGSGGGSGGVPTLSAANQQASTANNFTQLNQATAGGGVNFDSFIKGLDRATSALESMDNSGSSTAEELSALRVQIMYYSNTAEESQKLQDKFMTLYSSTLNDAIDFSKKSISEIQSFIPSVKTASKTAYIGGKFTSIAGEDKTFNNSEYNKVLDRINALAIKAKSTALTYVENLELADLMMPGGVWAVGQDWTKAIDEIDSRLKDSADRIKSYEDLFKTPTQLLEDLAVTANTRISNTIVDLNSLVNAFGSDMTEAESNFVMANASLLQARDDEHKSLQQTYDLLAGNITKRQVDILTIDESNIALQQSIWVKQDEISINDKLTAQIKATTSATIKLVESLSNTADAAKKVSDANVASWDSLHKTDYENLVAQGSQLVTSYTDKFVDVMKTNIVEKTVTAEELVNKFYTQALGRTAGSDELNGWITNLKNGISTTDTLYTDMEQAAKTAGEKIKGTIPDLISTVTQTMTTTVKELQKVPEAYLTYMPQTLSELDDVVKMLTASGGVFDAEESAWATKYRAYLVKKNDDIAANKLAESNTAAALLETSNTNKKTFADSFLTPDQLAQNMAKNLKVTLKTSMQGLSELATTLADDTDGLTNADLKLLEANKSLIANANSLIEQQIKETWSNAISLKKSFDDANKSMQDYVDELNHMPLAYTDISSALSDVYMQVGSIQNLSDATNAQSAISNFYKESVDATNSFYDAQIKELEIQKDISKNLVNFSDSLKISLIKNNPGALLGKMDFYLAELKTNFTTANSDKATTYASSYIDSLSNTAMSAADMRYETARVASQFASFGEGTNTSLADINSQLENLTSKNEDALSKLKQDTIRALGTLQTVTAEIAPNLDATLTGLVDTATYFLNENSPMIDWLKSIDASVNSLTFEQYTAPAIVSVPTSVSKLDTLAGATFSADILAAQTAHNAKVALRNSVVTNIDGSHKNGLDRVPFDGYLAELHKDERVLTKKETSDYERPIIINYQDNILVQVLKEIKELKNTIATLQAQNNKSTNQIVTNTKKPLLVYKNA